MSLGNNVTNVVIAGLGGQGVIKASDILADVAFHAGYDVKKSELHGMSQRGGSVSSDVRYGAAVFSPMVPDGAADYLVVLAADQVEINRHCLRAGGVLISVDMIDVSVLASQKSVNIALLGTLSNELEFSATQWLSAVRAALPEKLHESNIDAFNIGRAVRAK